MNDVFLPSLNRSAHRFLGATPSFAADYVYAWRVWVLEFDARCLSADVYAHRSMWIMELEAAAAAGGHDDEAAAADAEIDWSQPASSILPASVCLSLPSAHQLFALRVRFIRPAVFRVRTDPGESHG